MYFMMLLNRNDTNILSYNLMYLIHHQLTSSFFTSIFWHKYLLNINFLLFIMNDTVSVLKDDPIYLLCYIKSNVFAETDLLQLRNTRDKPMHFIGNLLFLLLVPIILYFIYTDYRFVIVPLYCIFLPPINLDCFAILMLTNFNAIILYVIFCN